MNHGATPLLTHTHTIDGPYTPYRYTHSQITPPFTWGYVQL